jgi:hypothetical protein
MRDGRSIEAGSVAYWQMIEARRLRADNARKEASIEAMRGILADVAETQQRAHDGLQAKP